MIRIRQGSTPFVYILWMTRIRTLQQHLPNPLHQQCKVHTKAQLEPTEKAVGASRRERRKTRRFSMTSSRQNCETQETGAWTRILQRLLTGASTTPTTTTTTT